MTLNLICCCCYDRSTDIDGRRGIVRIFVLGLPLHTACLTSRIGRMLDVVRYDGSHDGLNEARSNEAGHRDMTFGNEGLGADVFPMRPLCPIH